MTKTIISEKLVQRRKEMGLKQREMALKAGVKIRRYQSWEEGRSEPNLKHTVMLIEILQVDDMYLFLKENKLAQ